MVVYVAWVKGGRGFLIFFRVYVRRHSLTPPANIQFNKPSTHNTNRLDNPQSTYLPKGATAQEAQAVDQLLAELGDFQAALTRLVYHPAFKTVGGLLIVVGWWQFVADCALF